MIKWIFTKIWHKYLYYPELNQYAKVDKVTGWNSCRLDTPYGSRQRHTFLPFSWMK